MVADDEVGVAHSLREDHSTAKKNHRTAEVLDKFEAQGKKLDTMFARVDQFLDLKVKTGDETDQTFKLMACSDRLIVKEKKSEMMTMIGLEWC